MFGAGSLRCRAAHGPHPDLPRLLSNPVHDGAAAEPDEAKGSDALAGWRPDENCHIVTAHSHCAGAVPWGIGLRGRNMETDRPSRQRETRHI